jgi:hypothetical protein
MYLVGKPMFLNMFYICRTREEHQEVVADNTVQSLQQQLAVALTEKQDLQRNLDRALKEVENLIAKSQDSEGMEKHKQLLAAEEKTKQAFEVYAQLLSGQVKPFITDILGVLDLDDRFNIKLREILEPLFAQALCNELQWKLMLTISREKSMESLLKEYSQDGYNKETDENYLQSKAEMLKAYNKLSDSATKLQLVAKYLTSKVLFDASPQMVSAVIKPIYHALNLSYVADEWLALLVNDETSMSDSPKPNTVLSLPYQDDSDQSYYGSDEEACEQNVGVQAGRTTLVHKLSV